MSEKNITEESLTLGALLRLPYLALQKKVYGELTKDGFADVRPAHSAVFRHILPGGNRVTDLAERAEMTKQSMAYLVESLAERGYVELTPDPDDKRAKRVTLTERGQSFHAAAITVSRRVEAELAAHIGVDGVTHLRELLKAVVRGLTEETRAEGKASR